MRPLRYGGCAILFLTLFATAPAAHAWGCKGHQTVALIAKKHLTPAALQAFRTLLENQPADGSVHDRCAPADAELDPFARASTWPDAIRPKRPDTGPWHFIDIPRGTPRNQMNQACGAEGCVTRAIQEQIGVLRNKNAPGPARGEALRFIIHFVGDLHQPLHATTNGDRGGNCVPVSYFSRTAHLSGGSATPNLHAIWDTEMVERDMEGSDPAEYADRLDAAFAADIPVWQQAGIELDDWAWESHEEAEDTAYGALPRRIKVDPAAGMDMKKCSDNDDVLGRMSRKHLRVGQTYQDAAAAVFEERLTQAGVRLAMILNDAAK